ncbi:hypothetical protein [Sandaracinobacteroides saxicola]|uniref:Uncharacterized protein n=1 Tax=Sandaracinobacteroides saxicola TaxID=2759707 RepID=A0A7G5IK72_9SPHN|nr:hypothetical protein [Sandaracinobacteroides saxicola]QMW23764.1 hypothetical protein H3309_04590 [Sandaracinobacteroides saxicola]
MTAAEASSGAPAARLAAALARIERAIAVRDARHQRLRHEATAALADLDRLIARSNG